MLIDSHCHFNSLSKDKTIQLINSISGNYCFIDSSIDLESSKASCQLSAKYDFIYSALGFHPFSLKSFSDETLKNYKELIKSNQKIILIGEIGLDKTADEPLEKQEEVFVEFIKLAKELNLSIAIHNRIDDERVLNILDRFYSDYQKVIFHCFSYGVEFLEKILEKGGSVSFSLNVLRKNKKILDSLKRCPLDNLLLETDSPYMRIGKDKSTPLDVDKVYDLASSVKNVEKSQLENKISANCNRLCKGKFSF